MSDEDKKKLEQLKEEQDGSADEPAVSVAQPNTDNPDQGSQTEPAQDKVNEIISIENGASKEQPEGAEQAKVDEDSQLSETSDSSVPDVPGSKWYIIHTYSGHENRVANALKQRVESEHLENKILDLLVPTQEKIEIRGGKKETVKEKIFPGYLMVKMVLDDNSWLAVRTTPGVTSFVGIGNKPTPIPEAEVKSIVTFMTQGAAPTFKDVFLPNDTIKIIDGPFADFIGKVDTVDKEKGKIRVLVSIFGRETPVELDFLQITKL